MFDNVVCFSSKGSANHAKLQRYCVAYGGDCVSVMDGDVTHVIVPSLDVDKWDAETKKAVSQAASTGAHVVTAKWVWQSVKKRARQPISAYSL